MDRFIEEVGAYVLLEGFGKNVGVCGREAEDADEEVPPDSLEIGRRKPVLAAIGFISPVLREGDVGR